MTWYICAALEVSHLSYYRTTTAITSDCPDTLCADFSTTGPAGPTVKETEVRSTSSQTPTPSSNDRGSRLSAGEIAGIVVGVLGVIVTAIGVCLHWRTLVSPASKKPPAEQVTPTTK